MGWFPWKLYFRAKLGIVFYGTLFIRSNSLYRMRCMKPGDIFEKKKNRQNWDYKNNFNVKRKENKFAKSFDSNLEGVGLYSDWTPANSIIMIHYHIRMKFQTFLERLVNNFNLYKLKIGRFVIMHSWNVAIGSCDMRSPRDPRRTPNLCWFVDELYKGQYMIMFCSCVARIFQRRGGGGGKARKGVRVGRFLKMCVSKWHFWNIKI